MYEFDIKIFLQTLSLYKKKILLCCTAAFVVGLIIAFSIPKEYESSCTLAPELQEEGGMERLSSLASMAGINLGGGQDAIGPDLYPDVVSSNAFIVGLLDAEVETIDGKRCTYYDYLKNFSKRPWWAFVSKGMSALMKKLNPQPVFNESSGDGRMNPERLSREDEQLVEGLTYTVKCNINEADYTINLSVRAQDPMVAKIMVDTVMVHLQDFITKYRTGKARIDYEYYLALEKEAKESYTKAQKAYAKYCDTHQRTILKAYEAEQEELENEMQIALNSYNQIKQQLQLAEAKIQEKTPAFTIIDKASVPNKHVSPKKIMMIFGFVFLAAVSFVMWIYLRLLFSKNFGTRIKQ